MKIQECLTTEARSIVLGEYYVKVTFISLCDGTEFIYRVHLPMFEDLMKSIFEINLVNHLKLVTQIFSGYNVRDCQHISTVGHPDFIITDSSESKMFVEAKREKEKISVAQLQWNIEHSNENIYIMVVSKPTKAFKDIPISGELKHDKFDWRTELEELDF